MPAGFKRTKKEVKGIVENIGYIYINDYYNDNKVRKIIIRDRNGYMYDVCLNSILRGQGVRVVDKANPFTLSYNIPLWLKLNDSQFELLKNNEYNGADSKLNLYCKVCKDYPKMSWHNISKGAGCGVCDGDQIGINHNLAVQFPEIAAEWHPTKNGCLTPKDVTYGSNKKVWWLCPKNHEYYSSISSRTGAGSGCKTCSNETQESSVATELKKYVLENYVSEKEYRILKNQNTGQWLPYDIYIFGGKDPKINGVYIEVHGRQHFCFIPFWHKTKENFEYKKKLDKLKKNFAKKKGIYIEIDLRKIKTTEQAIEHIESFIEKQFYEKNE